jgi:hypothetical protein
MYVTWNYKLDSRRRVTLDFLAETAAVIDTHLGFKSQPNFQELCRVLIHLKRKAICNGSPEYLICIEKDALIRMYEAKIRGSTDLRVQ